MHRTAARKGLLRPLPPMDLPFLVLVLTLVAFGLVMLCSASSAVALYRRQDAFAYVRPQHPAFGFRVNGQGRQPFQPCHRVVVAGAAISVENLLFFHTQ